MHVWYPAPIPLILFIWEALFMQTAQKSGWIWTSVLHDVVFLYSTVSTKLFLETVWRHFFEFQESLKMDENLVALKHFQFISCRSSDFWHKNEKTSKSRSHKRSNRFYSNTFGGAYPACLLKVMILKTFTFSGGHWGQKIWIAWFQLANNITIGYQKLFPKNKKKLILGNRRSIIYLRWSLWNWLKENIYIS